MTYREVVQSRMKQQGIPSLRQLAMKIPSFSYERCRQVIYEGGTEVTEQFNEEVCAALKLIPSKMRELLDIESEDVSAMNTTEIHKEASHLMAKLSPVHRRMVMTIMRTLASEN